jgi:hypothetical protein
VTKTYLKLLPILILSTNCIASTPTSPQGQSSGAANGCSSAVLPADVLTQLETQYGSWKIQDMFNLSSSARRSLEYKKYGKPPECPGIAIGKFEKQLQGYAILLVPKNEPHSAYRLILFTRSSSGYKLTTLESSDDGGADNVFIRSVRLADSFNSDARRSLQMTATEGILIVESGASQFGADVYFLTKNGYSHKAREY